MGLESGFNHHMGWHLKLGGDANGQWVFFDLALHLWLGGVLHCLLFNGKGKMTTILTILNGKKTISGAILVALFLAARAEGQISDQIFYVGVGFSTFMLIVGLIHKAIKVRRFLQP